MKDQKTLDGLTAGTIAAMACAISRSISGERMKQLIGKPEDLQRLLLPLANDKLAWLLPILLSARRQDTLIPLFGFEDIMHCRSGTKPTAVDVISEACDKSLQLMSRDRAHGFANALCLEKSSSQCLTQLSHIFHFLYFDEGLCCVSVYPHKKLPSLFANVSKDLELVTGQEIFFFEFGHPGSLNHARIWPQE